MIAVALVPDDRFAIGDTRLVGRDNLRVTAGQRGGRRCN